MRRIYLLLSILAVFTLLIPSCQSSQIHPVRGEFVEGQLGSQAQTLNWLIASDSGASERYASFMVDPLAVFDNNYQIQFRCLAKDIEVSEDGLAYTVTIRNDLKWSDGTSVTAADYVFTIEELICASWLDNTYSGSWKEQIDGEDVFVTSEAVNDTTFRVVRQTVNPDFVYTIYGLMPYPMHIAQHYVGDAKDFYGAPEFNNMNYTGNLGAYLPVSFDNYKGFQLRRNPDYYLGQQNGAPYFESYRIKTYALQQMVYEALENGDIDFAYVEPQMVNAIKDSGTYQVFSAPTGQYICLAYNQRDNGWEGLKDVRVRQAISMAIDKNLLINVMYEGFADPAFSFVPPYSPWYNADVLNKYGTNVAEDYQEAIALIESAGFQQQMIDGQMRFVDEDGNPIKLIMPLSINDDFEQNLAILIRQNLLAIGLDIEPIFSVREQVYKDIYMNTVPGSDKTPTLNNGVGAVSSQAWDITLLSSYGYPLSLQKSEAFFSSTGSYNLFGFFNEKADALYAQLNTPEAVNIETRQQMYNELAQLISQEQPVDFLVYYKDNYAVSNNVKGIEPGANFENNLQFWYFE